MVGGAVTGWSRSIDYGATRDCFRQKRSSALEGPGWQLRLWNRPLHPAFAFALLRRSLGRGMAHPTQSHGELMKACPLSLCPETV